MCYDWPRWGEVSWPPPRVPMRPPTRITGIPPVPLPQCAETPQVRAMPLDSHHNNSLMTTDSHIFFTLCDCNYGFNCNCDGCVCNIVIWILLYIVYSLRQSCRSYGFIVWTRARRLLEVRAHSYWNKAKNFLDVCHLFFNPFRLCSRFRLVWIGP